MLMEHTQYALLWAKTLAHLKAGNRDRAQDYAQQLVDALRAEGLDVE